MDNYMALIVIAAVVGAVFLALTLLIPRMVKKGIDISGILSGTTGALDAADVVLDGVQGIFPEAKGLGIVAVIIDYAREATAAAEQLYKTSKIAAEERKQAATQIVYDCLKLAGIEVTDEVQKIVDGFIEAAVYTLPPSHEMN